VALGTDFISDILLISFTIKHPLVLKVGKHATDSALRTISEAIAKSACSLLDIGDKEILAEYRRAISERGKTGEEVEIYLYDSLAGGAGFSQKAGDIFRKGLENALLLLDNCPDNCDKSCYRCLRSFSNKFEHDEIDRHLGSSLLGYLLNGESLGYSQNRIMQSTERLFQDLQTRELDGIKFEMDVVHPEYPGITIPILATVLESNKRRIIYLHNPLTRDYLNEDIRYLNDETNEIIVPVDERLVANNLPQATSVVLEYL